MPFDNSDAKEALINHETRITKLEQAIAQLITTKKQENKEKPTKNNTLNTRT